MQTKIVDGWISSDYIQVIKEDLLLQEVLQEWDIISCTRRLPNSGGYDPTKLVIIFSFIGEKFTTSHKKSIHLSLHQTFQEDLIWWGISHPTNNPQDMSTYGNTYRFRIVINDTLSWGRIK